jgi:hypothetical protein
MPDNNGSALGNLLSDLLGNKALNKKLLNYAGKLLFRKTKVEFARYALPSDIISSIALKLLTGEIIWDSDNSSFTSFYFKRIRSEIANLHKKEKKFIPFPLESSKRRTDYEGEIDEESSLPAQFIIYLFEENNNKELMDPVEFKKIAFGIFSNSTEEYLVLDEMFKGNPNRQIAKSLGISEDEVHNIKKRISRILTTWVIRNKTGKVPKNDRSLSKKTKSLINPFIKRKPGKSNRGINNNGEII